MSRTPTALFVCTGNTCRSAMAEYLLRARLAAGGVPGRTGSAGVFAYGGSPASAGAVRALAARGIDGRRHRSRPLTPELVDESDLIVVMTRGHLENVLRRFPEAAGKVRLLKAFDGRAEGEDVEDPIGGDPADYERIRGEIEAALPELVLTMHDLGRSGGKAES